MYKSYDWVKKSFKNKIGKMDIPEGIPMEKKSLDLLVTRDGKCTRVSKRML